MPVYMCCTMASWSELKFNWGSFGLHMINYSIAFVSCTVMRVASGLCHLKLFQRTELSLRIETPSVANTFVSGFLSGTYISDLVLWYKKLWTWDDHFGDWWYFCNSEEQATIRMPYSAASAIFSLRVSIDSQPVPPELLQAATQGAWTLVQPCHKSFYTCWSYAWNVVSTVAWALW